MCLNMVLFKGIRAAVRLRKSLYESDEVGLEEICQRELFAKGSGEFCNVSPKTGRSPLPSPPRFGCELLPHVRLPSQNLWKRAPPLRLFPENAK